MERWQRVVGVEPDGIFGQKTLIATIAWQSRHGLSPDGIVGPKTWARLADRETPTDPGIYPFIQAKNYTKGPRKNPITLIVIHSMEAPEKPGTAERVARWFAGSNAPQASAHYCVDAISIWQCVKDSDIAWHAPGANHNGIGVELAGYAMQSSRDWLDEYSSDMLRRAAVLVADLCEDYQIPVIEVTAEQLKLGMHGVTTHANVTNGLNNGKGHWDPGPHFPMGQFLELVRTA